MAQRRMFNKSITNSSKFLKMPMTSRLLYYDLGMNADDDGFVEHFMVLRMTGATMQDLGVLELNGLVKVFDENVLWIKDWKENNYIQKDRYQPSKYLQMYKLDTICIQNVDTGKDRLELEIDNNIYNYIERNYGRMLSPIEYEKVEYWLSLYNEGIIKYAVEISVNNNKKAFSYVDKIIKNWKSAGYKTLEEIKKENKYKTSGLTEEQKKDLQEIEEYEWFNEESTDEEKEEMDKVIKEIQKL